MNYDDAKEEAMSVLSAVLDKAAAVVRTALHGHGLVARVKKIDYVAQVVVLNFPDRQPTSDLVDVIGDEVRHVWPEMPPMTATLFKVSQMNADLILDLNAPSGIQALAEQGNVKALAAIAAGTDALPVIHYVMEDGKPKQAQGMMTIHERDV